ncbi:MAG TPA: DNA-binding response regulator [Herpetosiphon sp.]|uniref:Transcriptional regulator, LuxR family n=1 Tax=Herpetosiphon aurantiacus (strain ATCC 23779 / DSM 785 / 114-95) TaxID=316274 RepID=A9AZB1_HERA2|nr:helix-turn-helix transcriptional regulator [Herpetosiphon sp.]ABX03657.1 transcriptional regulator, LuxR family [Herpetosiphon aurantiacus DSM 785]HBW51467.1 DNA-binding response regulator [Herpetosiphon sp.]
MSTSTTQLTASEHRVMQILIQGKTNKAIAHILQTTEGTIETSLHRIYSKLNVDNRVSATLTYLAIEPTKHARDS